MSTNCSGREGAFDLEVAETHYQSKFIPYYDKIYKFSNYRNEIVDNCSGDR